MNINDVFKIEQYDEAYEFCQANNYIIAEINPDGYGIRQFRLEPQPEPTIEELKQQQVYTLKAELSKIKEDVEQVSLFGMQRNDYDYKKSRCIEIIQQLRALEGKNN